MASGSESDVRTAVRERYGAIAKSIGSGPHACCGSVAENGADGIGETAGSCCHGGSADPISSNLYSESEAANLPAEALAASLGCGNPTALLPLEAGQTVLDLGSGGGVDVLLSARRVGSTGKVFGLDMTDEMLALARENQRKAGATNVEFLKGTIEAIPLPAGSIDVVISNCVINLSTDKDAVLREAFRVLKPGGRLAVSDVIARGQVPPNIRESVETWVSCVGGALEEKEYVTKLRIAGFEDVEVEVWRVYDPDMFASAFIRARKPTGACCSSACCTA
jgi:SAM-dependent methyltransferase